MKLRKILIEAESLDTTTIKDILLSNGFKERKIKTEVEVDEELKYQINPHSYYTFSINKSIIIVELYDRNALEQYKTLYKDVITKIDKFKKFVKKLTKESIQ